jgi:hypothetical protein
MKMAKHIHAELMAQYAQDAMETDTPWERWEFMHGNIDWAAISHNPAWDDGSRYRRKPRTININGHEVPEPVRNDLKAKDSYYTPAVGGHNLYNTFVWSDNPYDFQRLKNGVIHLMPEAAIAHANALLSFTSQKY